jgi:hypothetical protein
MKKPETSPFTPSNTVQPPDQIQGQIRQRAYEMYECVEERTATILMIGL